MDTPTRLGVAALVRQSRSGEISRDEFFEQLRALHAAGAAGDDPQIVPQQIVKEHLPGHVRQECSIAPSAPTYHPVATETLLDTIPNLLTGDAAIALAQEQRAHAGQPHGGVALRQAWSVPPDGHDGYRQDSLLSSWHWGEGNFDVFESASAVSSESPSWPVTSERGSPRLAHRSFGSRSVESSFSTFAQRNELWELQRARRCEERRLHRQAEELAECSFQPHSVPRAESDVRSSTRASKGDEGAVPTALSAQAMEELCARLSKPLTSRRCSQDALIWKKRREEEESKECSFHPDVRKSTSSYNKQVHSLSASALSGLDPGMSRDQCCTSNSTRLKEERDDRPDFVPQINPVPLNMPNARAYLAEDVFTRLSQPAIDDASSSLQSSIASAPSRINLEGTSLDSSFISFLQRQNMHEQDRLTRLREVDDLTAPPFQPELCERSHTLAERRRQRLSEDPSVDARLSAPMLRPQADSKKEDPECSFKPKINKISAERKGRSLTDLSIGDKQRSDAKIAKLRKQLDSQGMKDATFKPKIARSGVPGRMRILESPEGYVERLEKERKKSAKWREDELKRRQEEELRECKFKPTVKSAPAFVTRMAESYRLVQAMKERENIDDKPAARPEWR